MPQALHRGSSIPICYAWYQYTPLAIRRGRYGASNQWCNRTSCSFPFSLNEICLKRSHQFQIFAAGAPPGEQHTPLLCLCRYAIPTPDADAGATALRVAATGMPAMLALTMTPLRSTQLHIPGFHPCAVYPRKGVANRSYSDGAGYP